MESVKDILHSLQHCCACGITQANFSTNLHTPFITQEFDFSPEAHQAAWRVIEEGTNRLSDLDQAIKQLVTLRNGITDMVNQHHNFMAPIHRLPDDVMLAIAEQTRFTKDGEKTAPWKFSVVCKKWRQLALSHPYLWADIQFCPPYECDSRVMAIKSLCERVETQLERARSCALNLQVALNSVHSWQNKDENDSDYYYEYEDVDPLLERTARNLLSNTSQCRLLQLYGEIPNNWDLSELRRSLTQGNLETVMIDHHSWLHDNFLVNTPALRTAVLRCLDLHATPIQRSGLTNLTLGRCYGTASEILGVLRLTEQLRTLHLSRLQSVSEEHESVNTPLDTISLPQLHELSLRFNHGHIARKPAFLTQSIVQHLIAPSLIKLCLEHVSKDVIEEFLRRSGLESRLQLLEVRECNIQKCILPLLHTLHAIEALVIETRRYEANSLIIALRSDGADGTPQLCSRLTRLVLKDTNIDSVDLHTTIQSRVRPPATPGDSHRPQSFLKHLSLESVTLTDLNQDNLSFKLALKWFEDMKAAGLLDSDSHADWGY